MFAKFATHGIFKRPLLGAAFLFFKSETNMNAASLATILAVILTFVVEAVALNPSATQAGTAADGMFHTDVTKLDPQLADSYSSWLKRIENFADRAFISCVKLRRDSGEVPKAKIGVSVAIDLALDTAKCEVQRELVLAGIDQDSSGRQCQELEKSLRQATSALKPTDKRCAMVEIKRFNFETDAMKAKIGKMAGMPPGK